jgi:uncharacterized membrane protein HdeD (DUF308 family)
MAETDRYYDVYETKLWVALLVRGILAALFGIAALSYPYMPYTRLATIFGVYVIVDGALALFSATRSRTVPERRWWSLAIEGSIEILAGVLAFVFPATAALRVIGGLRGVLGGFFDALWCLHRDASDRRFMIGFGGISTVAFGIVILAWPGPGPVALPYLLGVSGMLSGAFFTGGALLELGELEAAHAS